MRKCLITLPLFAFLLGVPAVAKDKHGNKGSHGNAKDAVEWRHRTETERHRGIDQIAGPKATQGHRPHDLNGDGVITRNEWPGNDNSWRRMDRNGDGVISDADRRVHPKKRVYR